MPKSNLVSPLKLKAVLNHNGIPIAQSRRCTKAVYPSEAHVRATAAMREMYERHLRLYEYHCPTCRGWHLTKATRRVR
jgi:hypothetical protein